MYKYLLLIIFLFAFSAVRAQTPDSLVRANKKDATNRKLDSITSKPFKPKVKKEEVYHPDSTHDVHKAWMRSLMIPGWGQVYNKNGLYWRLPVLYGGFAGLGYYLVFNITQYRIFLYYAQRRELGFIDTDFYPYASNQAVYDAKNYYLRNVQLLWFSIAAAWGINIIDAYVNAKFIHSYTVDNNLSFKITPSLISQPVYASSLNTTFTPALKITLLFK